MIELPPPVAEAQLLGYLIRPNAELERLAASCNDSYDYWTEVKYKRPLPDGVTPADLWAYVKMTRLRNSLEVWKQFGITLSLTNQIQKACHELDMNFGGSWGAEHIISSEQRERYLISSLMEEAISSSQMEGASTTRQIAKDMLRKEIKPRDRSQQMIANNYRTIRFIVEHRDRALTPELLLQVHALMTEHTLEHPEDAGRFRTDDEVVVEDSLTHEVVHTPPSHRHIGEFVRQFCLFFNDQDHDSPFIHPILRGIIIHFMIAYVHPFVDGNGRTARALFYWYMIRRGYWLVEYLSISRIIARSKRAYEKAYLYTEADGGDVSYFVAYHLRALVLAFRQLQDYIVRKNKERQSAHRYLQLEGINARQAELIRLYVEDPKLMLTAKELQNRFQISPTTAKSDLMGLIALGLVSELSLNKVKRGYIRTPLFEERLATLS